MLTRCTHGEARSLPPGLAVTLHLVSMHPKSKRGQQHVSTSLTCSGSIPRALITSLRRARSRMESSLSASAIIVSATICSHALSLHTMATTACPSHAINLYILLAVTTSASTAVH